MIVPSPFARLSILLALTTIAAHSSAQTMAPSNLPSDVPTADASAGETAPNTPVIQSSDVARPGTAVSATERPFRYDFGLHVHEVYDDNVLLTPSSQIKDWYTRIAPAVHFGLGDTTAHHDNFLDFDYEPAFVLFAKEDSLNTVEHVGHVSGQYTFSRLTIGVAEDIIATETGDPQLTAINGTFVNGINIDTGRRRRINTFDSHLNASYDLTGKTFLSAGGEYLIVDYPSVFDDSQRADGNLFLNYRYGDKLTFGIGGTGGHDFRDSPNTDENFEQANLRASYLVSGKLTANGTVGVEFRQRDDGSNGTTPVFDLTLTYNATDSTSVSIQGSRRVISSAGFVGQDYNSTQFQVVVQQRFLQRIFASVTGGYQNLDYVNAPAGFPSRQDNYFFIQPSIDVRITNFWFVGGFYNHRNNDSNFTQFGFEENQAGFHTVLRF